MARKNQYIIFRYLLLVFFLNILTPTMVLCATLSSLEENKPLPAMTVNTEAPEDTEAEDADETPVSFYETPEILSPEPGNFEDPKISLSDFRIKDGVAQNLTPPPKV